MAIDCYRFYRKKIIYEEEVSIKRFKSSNRTKIIKKEKWQTWSEVISDLHKGLKKHNINDHDIINIQIIHEPRLNGLDDYNWDHEYVCVWFRRNNTKIDKLIDI